MKEPEHKQNILDFPVVGIGASAGGLEALQDFFKNMPINPNVAFVVVQHLSPDYKSFMSELLSRKTKLKIHTAEDGLQVEKNHIYLIPPRKNMTISNGKLLLFEQAERKVLNLPIDIFLKSLATDQEKNAIGIILSGTGSDGALGIRAIKEYGGIAMVQDDQTAKFDGMPRSSISTGMVDFILPPEKLAEELVNYVKHPFVNRKEMIEKQINSNDNQLLKIITLIKEQEGVDFSNYKENTIIRRLEKRMSINRVSTISQYIGILNKSQKEVSTLFNDLLIGVTRFFREEEAFAKIQNSVVPRIVERANKEVRVWISGCSTGEEAYSLAILFREYQEATNNNKTIKIFATDIDSAALEYAGAGIYPESIISEISPKRIGKYFVKKNGGYQVNEKIRSMIVFAKHNILQDPPFSKIDLISCRNLLIYLKTKAQQRVLSLFYISLVENGYMFLGNSESLGAVSEGFDVIDSKLKIYIQKKGYKATIFQNYGSVAYLHSRVENNQAKNLYNFTKEKSNPNVLEGLLKNIIGSYLPPSVLIDSRFNIVYTINDASKFISIPQGQISLNMLDMLPKKMSIIASNLLRRTDKSDTEIVMDNIVDEKHPDTQLSISAKKIVLPKTKDAFYLVSFIEKDKNSKNEQVYKIEKIDINHHYEEKINELEKELQAKSENLQATVEELETSNEELQSSNEELIASNEELQSTNEELQSVNEELYTVNSEHIKKIDELTELYADVDNLLKSTKIGTLYLGNDLAIRKINDVGSQLTNILQTDIGRPISHLSFDQLYKDFVSDIKEVAEQNHFKEKAVKVGKNWYMLRIIPYQTVERKNEGVIIVFVDITSLKETEAELKAVTDKLENVIAIGGISWWEWNAKDDKVVTGAGKYEMLGYKKGEVGNSYKDWMAIVHPDDYQATMKAMKKHLSGELSYYETEYRIKTKSGGYVWYRDKGKINERDHNLNPVSMSGVVMNITKQKESEAEQAKLGNELIVSENKYDVLFETMSQGVVFQNFDGEIINANQAAQEILGLSLAQMQGRTSDTPEWKAKKEDGSDFPGNEHPAMIALQTGKPVRNVKMQVYNPQKQKYVWIKINAMPILDKQTGKAVQVYAMFNEI